MPPSGFVSLWKQETAAVLPESAKGWAQAIFLQLIIWIVFGAVIPWRKGLEFFDPAILGAYACLGVVFAVPSVIRFFELPSLARVLARVVAGVLYGEVMALGMLATGIAVVYWTHRNGVFFPPEWGGVISAAAFGAALALALTLGAAWLTLQFSAFSAKLGMRLALFALLLLFFFRGRSLPDFAWQATAVALAGCLLFLGLLRRTTAGTVG